jgi:hypothetical protein
MADPAREALMLHFDRRLMAQFRGSAITSDGGLLTYREVDNALGLTTISADTLADARSGKNGRRQLVGLLRQPVFGGLAGHEDVNDAERLCRDPPGGKLGKAAAGYGEGRVAPRRALSTRRLYLDQPCG